jgi:hypothetical protein
LNVRCQADSHLIRALLIAQSLLGHAEQRRLLRQHHRQFALMTLHHQTPHSLKYVRQTWWESCTELRKPSPTWVLTFAMQGF